MHLRKLPLSASESLFGSRGGNQKIWTIPSVILGYSDGILLWASPSTCWTASNVQQFDRDWFFLGKNTWKAMSPGGDECIKIMDNAVQSQRIMLTQIARRLLERSL